jgi:hypothetical protein
MSVLGAGQTAGPGRCKDLQVKLPYKVVTGVADGPVIRKS